MLETLIFFSGLSLLFSKAKGATCQFCVCPVWGVTTPQRNSSKWLGVVMSPDGKEVNRRPWKHSEKGLGRHTSIPAYILESNKPQEQILACFTLGQTAFLQLFLGVHHYIMMQCKSLNSFYIPLVLEIKYDMKHFPMQTFFLYELIPFLEFHQQADWIFSNQYFWNCCILQRISK